MINKDNSSDQEEVLETESEENKPDDAGGFFVQGFLKIFDPVTGKIITQGRA